MGDNINFGPKTFGLHKVHILIHWIILFGGKLRRKPAKSATQIEALKKSVTSSGES
ncbi:Uncharacterized protein FKW44_019576 [Caligus rogercresseyi]|uniref:Uncharacterized protein n=1 Tax=Caligus rogercresseyi TaxID=217165 RepID=A0A7T8JXH8_CALRO|nr:Uncharacterized protein FKW44_019576 [Caligus rogercresseyi]